MGKRSQRKKAVNTVYSDDDSVSTASTSMSDVTQVQENEEVDGGGSPLDGLLDALYEKRGSTREKALEALSGAFSNQVEFEFADTNCVTLQHLLVSSIKRGSTAEACHAAHALALLGLTVGCGDHGHKILEESAPHLSQALKPGADETKRASVIRSLAILTFVGGFDTEETQRSMQMIWQLIHPKAGANAGLVSKAAPAVVAAAVSAWAFLLTTIDGWMMSCNEWKESISYLSTLLDKDDRAVRIAAGEAIALIFEIASLKLFSGESIDDSLDGEGKVTPGAFASLSALKGKILQQVKTLSVEASGKGLAKKDLSSQRNLFRDILDFIESGYSPETVVKLQFGDRLKASTWTHCIQLNFLKQIVGSGFVKHMQENEFFHQIFNFVPKKSFPEKNLEKMGPPDRVGMHIYQVFNFVPKKSLPEKNLKKMGAPDKRLFKSPNSIVSKARTQFLNKQRAQARDRNTGHFTVLGDET